MDSNLNNKRLKEIKIVVVGSCGTGKTSLCHRWIKNIFSEEYRATVMTDFSFKIFEYKGNCYKVQLWDLAGQDKNIHTTKVLTKGAHGCLVLSDVTDKNGLNHTIKWKKAIDQTKFIDGDNLPCVLIQNKIDLIVENAYPKEDRMKTFVKEHNFINYFLTSAKMGINIDECMKYLIEHIIDKLIEHSKNTNTPHISEERKSIVIQNPKEKEALMRVEETTGCC